MCRLHRLFRHGLALTLLIPILLAPMAKAALTVTTTEDVVNANDNQTSLREALAQAQTLGGPQTITFSNSIANGAVNFHDGTARTITLGAAGELAINANVTIAGPGADRLTVSGANARRIFNIGSVTPAVNVSVSGLTLANGRAQGTSATSFPRVQAGSGRGGAILNNSTGTVSLIDCVISGSTARGGDANAFPGAHGAAGQGGAIYVGSTSGTLSLLRTTISGNFATGSDADSTGGSAGGASGDGAGIYNGAGASIQIVNSTFSGNLGAGGSVVNNTSGPARGGAIYHAGGGPVAISGSTFATNRVVAGSGQNPNAGTGGAIYLGGAGNVTVTTSAFVGNSAQGTSGATGGAGTGGALASEGAGTLRVVNSTLAQNSASGGMTVLPGGLGRGGGIANLGSGPVIVIQCTISGNSAVAGKNFSNVVIGAATGGGLANSGTGTVTVANTIVAGNTSTTSEPDVNGAFTSSGSNLIGIVGTATGLTNGTNGDQVGTAASPINPLLGALADHGGPTQTMIPALGSPALDAGSVTVVNLNGLSTDQRGTGFPREVFSRADIGALEATRADLGITTVTAADGALWYLGPPGRLDTLRVYREVAGVAVWVGNGLARQIGVAQDGSIVVRTSTGDVFLRSGSASGSGTNYLAATKVTAGDGATWFLGPDGPNANDRSIYRWADGLGPVYSGQAGTVLEVSGGLVRTTTVAGTTFERSGSNSGLGAGWAQVETPSLTVTTTSDNSTSTDGLTSLREAIAYANSNPGADTITFDDGSGSGGTNFLDTTADTITLNGTQLPAITQSVTINGPTVGVTISGNNQSRVFQVSAGTVNLNRLTVTAGVTQDLFPGGGIRQTGGTLRMSECTVKANRALDADGGGLGLEGGSAIISNSTFAGNTTEGSPGAAGGGAAVFNSGGTLTLSNCTFSGNLVNNGGDGGALRNDAGTATFVNCTISGNTVIPDAGGSGGGIVVLGGTVQCANTIIAGNSGNFVGADVQGACTSLGNNLIGKINGSSGFTNGTNGDRVGTNAAPLNPLLGTLGNFGGLTETIPILSGSPALNAGSNALALDADGQPLTTDQRGQSRIRGGTVDIGAFESAPSRLYIDQSVTGGNGSGDSWTNAMPELRTATAMAQTDPNVSEIWVAQGTYKPAVAGGDRAATFRLRSGLAIYGGFTGTETQLDQRNADPGTNGTILDGDLNANDTDDRASKDDNSYHVVTGSNTDATAIFDGFTVRRGYAISGAGSGEGGGMLIVDGSPSVSRVLFLDNFAVFQGGGLWHSGGSPVFDQVTFRGNICLTSGGAISTWNGSLVLKNSTIFGNSARTGYGGGVEAFGGGATLINVVLQENTVVGTGRGGAFASLGGSHTLTNVRIIGSNAGRGSIFYAQGGRLTVINSSLSGNSANHFGSFYTVSGGAIELQNCVYWNNGTPMTGSEDGTGSVTFKNSIVQGSGGSANWLLSRVVNGGGNLDADPQFVDAANGNLRLRSSSPAVNAGDNSVVTASTDLDGAARIIGANVDLGAYELIAPPTLTNTQLSIINGGSLADLAALTGAAPAGGVFSGTGVSVDGGGKYVFNSTGLALGTQVTVTYTVNGPNGTSNQSSFTITVLETPSLTVTTTSDTSTNTDGLTSLREALAYAATLTGPQTIRFNGDPAVTEASGPGVVDFYGSTPQTITVTGSALPGIVTDTSIFGPGSGKLTVAKDSNLSLGRMFDVSGGAAFSASGLTVEGTQMTAIFSPGGGSVVVSDCVVKNLNTAIEAKGSVTATNCTLTGNFAAIFSIGGSSAITVTDCDLSGNSNSGILGGGRVTATRCNFDGNSQAGIFGVNGPVTASQCSFNNTGNSGINGGTSIVATDCQFLNNQYAGIFSPSGQVVARTCTFNGNGNSGVFSARAVLLDCEISNNDYGVFLTGQGSELANCTITNNRIVGVSVSNAATIGNCTITGNGHGIFSHPQLTVVNSIVVGNAQANVSQSFIDGGNNLLAGTPAAAGLQVDGNGKAVVRNNGGPTGTVALLPGSAAIDGGGNGGIGADPATGQKIIVSGSAGTFTLAFDGVMTTALAFDADAATVQSALGGLSTIAGVGGTVAVTPGASGYHLTFGGSLAGTLVPVVAVGSGGASVQVAMGLSAVTTDQRGQSRIRGGTVDIGAFESAPSRLYIDQSVTGGNGSGDSWANAMPELRTATAMAHTDPNVSEIWVAKGTYSPAPANGDRAATFQLRNGLAIYGGFASGQTQLSQRDSDPATNGTRLSGDLNGNDGADFANNGENSYHVTVGSNTDATAVLDGFTVSGGNADGGGNDRNGAGMLNLSGSPSLTHVTISGNSASFDGGGICNRNGSSPTLFHVTLSGNSARDGGGIYNFNSSSPTLSHVTISGNSASRNGGGIYNLNSSSSTLSHVTLSGNSASGDGGGIYNDFFSSPTLTNVTLSGNSASFEGGGIFNVNSSPTLTNVTLSGNSASGSGGGILNVNSSRPTMRNCILWGNSGGEIANSDISATVSDSLVQGGYGGGTNILDADPQFVSPITAAAPTTTGNLRLRSTSPAVNAGDNSVVTASTDLDGAARIIGANVDLGAYELIAPPTLTNAQLSIINGGTLTDLAALTGAAPAGGVFSGTGVSVDGNGKYVFDSSGMPLGSQVTITYTVSGPGGTSNTTTASVTIIETPSLTVTTDGDLTSNIDGQTSLREAFSYAATLTGPQTITFSSSTANGAENFHDGTPRTIELLGRLQVRGAVEITIAGPGADLLKISGRGKSRVFSFGDRNAVFALRDLTLADGFGIVSDNARGSVITNDSTLTLERCVIRDSETLGVESSGGGGLYTTNTTTIIDSTFTGNLSRTMTDAGMAFGGGIYATESARVKVINSTISGNAARSVAGQARGGGIYAEGNGEAVELIQSTVTDNAVSVTSGTDTRGGGVFGNITAGNSLVAGNTSTGDAADVSGNIVSRGHNLILNLDATATFSGDTTGNLTTLDPQLAPLGAYGGPTPTHALLPGSPAIDAGADSLAVDESSAPLTKDQRGTGFTRIAKGSRGTVTATVDIGAFELFAAPEFTTDEFSLSIAAAPLDLIAATGVSPAGGVFSGPGVNGGFFDPATQVPGVYTLTYTVTDAFGVANVSSLTVTVLSLADLTLTQTKRFKTTLVGSSSRSQRVYIRNLGDQPARALRVEVRGRAKKDFVVTQPAARSLLPGASTFFQVSFRPREEGNREAEVTVLSDSSTVSVKLRGRGQMKSGVRPPRAVK